MFKVIAQRSKVTPYMIKLYDSLAARTSLLSFLPFISQKAKARACETYIRTKIKEEGKEALASFIAEVPSRMLKYPRVVSTIADQVYKVFNYEEISSNVAPVITDRIEGMKDLSEKQKLYVYLMLGVHDAAKKYLELIPKLRKPDFVIAGAQKAGTTWLVEALNNYPGAWIPPTELHYFTSNRCRWAWKEYLSLFSLYNVKVTGEKSTTYLEVIDEVVEKLPETQVFVILRDPFDRLVSHYFHDVRNNRYPDRDGIYNIKDFVDRDSASCLERGLYYQALKNSFSKVNVLFFQDLVSDPRAFLTLVLSSLGLTDINLNRLIPDRKINSSDSRLGTSYKDFLKTEGLAETLKGYYFDDVTELGRATGRDLSSWIEW